MKARIFRIALPALALVMTVAGWAMAGEFHCCFCGRGNCHKRCRLVCEEKKVEIVCWGCKPEDFCLGCCSKPGCEHCEEVCTSCNDPSKVCCESKTFLWREWFPPRKARIYTKTKLMKKIETKKIPSYKWVVEDVCAECEVNYPSATPAPGVEVPPKPDIEAKSPPKSPAKVRTNDK